MKLIMLKSFILSSILVATCFPNSNGDIRKRAAEKTYSVDRYRYRNRYVADPKKILEAALYQELHARMYEEKPSEFKLWPELDILDQLELVDHCQKYILCVGGKDKVIGDNAILLLKLLKYYHNNKSTPIKRKRKNYRQNNEVRMLRCKVSNKRVYQFIRGIERYSAFFVQATNTTKRLFTIVGACRADVFNTITSEHTEITKVRIKRARRRKKLRVDLKAIEKTAPYQEVHVKMYDDLDAYKTWPELEDKGKCELIFHCYVYIECFKLIDYKVNGGRVSLDLLMLKYFIVNSTQLGTMKHKKFKQFHPKRWVRTLNCPTNVKIRRFIKASNGYSVFLIEPTDTTYNKFTIIRACGIDDLNNSREIVLSSNDSNQTSKEYESGDKLPNEADKELLDEYNSDEASLSQESKEKVFDNRESDSVAFSQKYNEENDLAYKFNNDVEMGKGDENAHHDSEATISDDNMYLGIMDLNEHDSE